MVNTLLITWIVIGVVVLYLIIIFNSIITLKNRVKNSWHQIDVQLKRRYDLIPNLIETVKGYAKHEKKIFTEVTRLRGDIMKGSLQDRAKASDQLSNALKSIFAVAENYPNLRASENFKSLQEELAGTENKISYSRQNYNDMVMLFNTKIQVFPTNIIARILNFKEEEYFKAEGVEKENVKVKFE